MIDPNALDLDLNSLARKVVQRLDRRNQRAQRQPVTRIAAQYNGTVMSNKHRILNFKSAGVNVVADDTNRRSNIVIPCGYLYCVVDGGGQAIIASSKPQTSVHVHDNLQVVQWTVIGDQSGSITFDLRKASYSAYPSTSTIITGFHPALSGSQKNKSTDYIDPNTGQVNVAWTPLGWTNLLIGDILDIVVTSSGTVTRVTLILQCQAVS